MLLCQLVEVSFAQKNFSPFRPSGKLGCRNFCGKWNTQPPVMRVYSNLLTRVIMRGIVSNSIDGVSFQNYIATDTGGRVLFFCGKLMKYCW